MEITVGIGESPEQTWKEFSEIDEAWIAREVNQRLEDEIRPCIIVTIRSDEVSMTLPTPECSGGGGGGRRPNRREEEINDLWRKRVLAHDPITGGHVVSFLKSIQQLI